MPKEINELYASVFDFRLRYIWQKITQAFKAIKQDILTKADLISIGANIIKRIFQVWKEKSRSEYVDMTVDEMCASAFKTAREVFYNALGALHMEDYAAYVERRTIHYAREQAVLIPDVREIYILHDVKSEKISNSEFKIREQAAIQLEEAKQCIPYLEGSFLYSCPEATLEDIRDNVVTAIEEGYQLIDVESLDFIFENYEQYTHQYDLIKDSIMRSIGRAKTEVMELNTHSRNYAS